MEQLTVRSLDNLKETLRRDIFEGKRLIHGGSSRKSVLLF